VKCHIESTISLFELQVCFSERVFLFGAVLSCHFLFFPTQLFHNGAFSFYKAYLLNGVALVLSQVGRDAL